MNSQSIQIAAPAQREGAGNVQSNTMLAIGGTAVQVEINGCQTSVRAKSFAKLTIQDVATSRQLD